MKFKLNLPEFSFYQLRLSNFQWKKSKLLLLLLLVTLILTNRHHVNAVSFPVRYQQEIFFYKPAENVSKSQLVSIFDNFILTHGDESYRDGLISLGITSPMLQYVRFDAIQDPGSCSAKPDRNQVAFKIGDFCNISAQNPGWFLLDHNGNRMYNGDMVMMDPGSSGWRNFFLTRIQETQQMGWNGVFLDNVEGSLVKRSQYGQMPANYSTDSSYQDAIRGMLDHLYNSYFRPNGRPMFANVISLKPVSVWFNYLDYLDGAMCEAWATGWGNTDWRTTSQWLENLERAEQTQNRSKWTIGVGQGNKTNYFRERFSYYSYLLVDHGRMFFRYGLPANYREAWTYSHYGTDYGLPLGNKYQQGSWYCRDYTKGKVCVNPSTHGSYFEFN